MDKARQKQVQKRFGARLRAARKAYKGRKLSQEALALTCDLARSYVDGIERGENNLSLINIVRLAEMLEVEPRRCSTAGGEMGKRIALALAALPIVAGCVSAPPAAPAAPAPASLPIATGAYVAEDKSCGDREPLFRYDGRSMGWSGGGSAERPMYPIRVARVRRSV